MKKLYGLKKKFIFYVMSVSILIAVLLICIMSFSSVHTTNSVLLDNMQITARIASQYISSNLHLLTERMYNLSQDQILTMPAISTTAKNKRLTQARQEIEFV